MKINKFCVHCHKTQPMEKKNKNYTCPKCKRVFQEVKVDLKLQNGLSENAYVKFEVDFD